MADFKIITNTTADLPLSYIEENNLGLMVFNYTIKGETYGKGHELDWKEFYELMRQGNMTMTSQVNPEECKEYFEEYLKETKELLYLCFSSGLSGTYSSACLAAEMVMEDNPGCKITVVDTKCASMGEGLLVDKAVQLKKNGKSMEETVAWVEENIPHLVHIFTVDDLNHLYRGGRVSKAAAVVGTIVGVKPVLHVDDEGHLIPISKVRGRKKSLNALVDFMEEKIGKYRDENDIIFISHGDSLEDAEFVRDEVKARFGIDNFMINHIGPTVGAHAGPGTIALFFMGETR
ncbi:DegV family protein [Kineothrix sp. MB12-C1]|uniref:DegV family protein n=1 Tax=Kineothrix sp. MB12-C1 TaxID=3070215 RepID=UPI0027D2C472|nr:DegV family protein [Kineothrix sp. MB12-C1]WMC92691.1 DegV family protein [Kineothrix sp. MB12-C1]WMC92734.1 DegV family protein [Kineothrix sp. MB12-C1]